MFWWTKALGKFCQSFWIVTIFVVVAVVSSVIVVVSSDHSRSRCELLWSPHSCDVIKWLPLDCSDWGDGMWVKSNTLVNTGQVILYFFGYCIFKQFMLHFLFIAIASRDWHRKITSRWQSQRTSWLFWTSKVTLPATYLIGHQVHILYVL